MISPLDIPPPFWRRYLYFGALVGRGDGTCELVGLYFGQLGIGCSGNAEEVNTRLHYYSRTQARAWAQTLALARSSAPTPAQAQTRSSEPTLARRPGWRWNRAADLAPGYALIRVNCYPKPRPRLPPPRIPLPGKAFASLATLQARILRPSCQCSCGCMNSPCRRHCYRSYLATRQVLITGARRA